MVLLGQPESLPYGKKLDMLYNTSIFCILPCCQLGRIIRVVELEPCIVIDVKDVSIASIHTHTGTYTGYLNLQEFKCVFI